MNYIGITLRVDCSDQRERRDLLDQRWYSFLKVCGLIPLLLPNDEKISLSLLKSGLIKGIVLTGGNTLVSLGGDTPERDALEKQIISFCLENKMPLLGVCRGMQMIQHFFGVSLQPVVGHVGVKHALIGPEQDSFVNSFHDYGAYETVDELIVAAKAIDGVVKAIRHKLFPIRGIMWHPEREEIFNKNDIILFKKHFFLSAV